MQKEFRVSPTGKNLSILLTAEANTKPNDWLMFASWYSGMRMLTDAKFAISVPRMCGHREWTFQWADRIGVRKFHHSAQEIIDGKFMTFPLLVVPVQGIFCRKFHPEETEDLSQKLTCGDTVVYNDGEAKEVKWLSSEDMTDNPVILRTGPVVGPMDLVSWAKQTKEHPFTAQWQSKNQSEKLVNECWKLSARFFAQVVR